MHILPCNTSTTQNYTADQIAKLIVTFMTFQLGMISTIVFFRGKTQRASEGFQPNTMADNFRIVEFLRRSLNV
jgi:hypothetical protein